MIVDGVNEASVGLPPGVDAVVIAAVVVAVVLAGLFAWLKGYGRDPLERLSEWARGRGFEYVPSRDPDEVAAFVGPAEGLPVEVSVRRVPGRRLIDLPPRVTIVAAGEGEGEATVVIQPAGWVLDGDGNAVGAPVPSGDAAFDEMWSARGEEEAVRAVLSPRVRELLLGADAQGLVVAVGGAAINSVTVTVRMPGVCADPRELERRLLIVTGVARALT